ncbi:Alkyl hydroperoxide reductase protein F [Staphylococcus aureus]|nr:Alkyl hydroperoxide reductase protein F [Staphylococcus aureus]
MSLINKEILPFTAQAFDPKKDQFKEVTQEDLNGIFVQIGLLPNTSWLKDAVELNERGEIVIDRNNNTNVPGIFAAGDVTDQKNKQIIISMGAGANAALNAFDYIIRN